MKVDTRLMIDRAYLAAKRSGIDFNIASIPASFNAPSRGPFDPDYMTALFQLGETQGKSATPFANEPPAYPGRPTAATDRPCENWSELMSKAGGVFHRDGGCGRACCSHPVRRASGQ